jgi:hypothetical protein
MQRYTCVQRLAESWAASLIRHSTKLLWPVTERLVPGLSQSQAQALAKQWAVEEGIEAITEQQLGDLLGEVL